MSTAMKSMGVGSVVWLACCLVACGTVEQTDLGDTGTSDVVAPDGGSGDTGGDPLPDPDAGTDAEDGGEPDPDGGAIDGGPAPDVEPPPDGGPAPDTEPPPPDGGTEDATDTSPDDTGSGPDTGTTACEGPNPAGCASTPCGEGEICSTAGDSCVPSACFCDEATGAWGCTDDCGGGVCIPEGGVPCTSDRDCAMSEVCFEGTCRGSACPDLWDPQCGINGRTYSNACEAGAAGVEIAYRGVCENACNSAADCEPGQACVENVCRWAGDGCTFEYAPVCGIDNVTYSNRCFAETAGVAVQYEGECDLPGAGEGEPCGSDLDCEVWLVCTDAMECAGLACPLVYMPVCGVDGRTYGNSCEARGAHVEVASEGECPAVGCTSNADCSRGDVCLIGEGICGPPCTIMCLIYDPVCGEDGMTYGCGEPEAHCNGVRVAYDGECRRP